MFSVYAYVLFSKYRLSYALKRSLPVVFSWIMNTYARGLDDQGKQLSGVASWSKMGKQNIYRRWKGLLVFIILLAFLSMQVFVLFKLAATYIITAFKKHPIKDKRGIFVDLLILTSKLHIIIEISNMGGYQLSSNDLKNVPSKYICKQCGFVLRAPMQTPCAHFYCRTCLEDLKR